jgi:hemolysin activation/secretion protein
MFPFCARFVLYIRFDCLLSYCERLMRYFLRFSCFIFTVLFVHAEDATEGRLRDGNSVDVKDVNSTQKNISFTVKSWKYDGVRAPLIKKLTRHLREFDDRLISFDDLSQIVERVEEFYKLKGRIASVTIPPQDVTKGELFVVVVEAKVGNIKFDKSSTSNVNRGKIKSSIESYTPKGSIYDAGSMNRGLLLADDLPGVSMTGFLQSGEQDDEVDLILKTSEEAPYIADLALDNAHARSLGTYRTTMAVSLISPFDFGETIGLQTLKSEGSRYGRISLGLPLGSRGWRMSIYGSTLGYNVITDELAALDIEGEVDEIGLTLRYPLIRSRKGNLYSTYKLDHRIYLSSVAQVVQKHYSIEGISLNLSGNVFDTIWGGGANSASFGILHGRVSAKGATLVNEGYHSLLKYSVSRQQTISEKLSLFISLSGQVTQDVSTSSLHNVGGGVEDFLDSAESFSLGGINGVRAYPSGEATGSEGRLFSGEFRYLLGKDLMAKALYDWGWVGSRDPTSIGPSEYEISGAGLNMAWSAPLGFNLQATYARRFGENPNLSATGTDQDGSLKEDRLWVVLGRSF